MNVLSTMDPTQSALMSAPLSTTPTGSDTSGLLSQMLGTPADPNANDPLTSLLNSLSSSGASRADAGSAPSGGNSGSGFDPSSPAQLFQALGVDPSHYNISSQTSAIKFDLAMEDDRMSVGAAGQINYSARTIHLSVTMIQATGSASNGSDSNGFVADGMQFSLQFSYAETDATTNASGGLTPTGSSSANGLDAFGGMKDAFVQAVTDAMQQVAGVGQDGNDAGSELLQIGQHLGDKLFSLMGGVMQVGASDPSTATYGDPGKGSGGASSKLAAMQQVADNLTAETAQLQQELKRPKPAPAVPTPPAAATGADKMSGDDAASSKPVQETANPSKSSPPADGSDRDKGKTGPVQPLMKPFMATQPGAAKSGRLDVVA